MYIFIYVYIHIYIYTYTHIEIKCCRPEDAASAQVGVLGAFEAPRARQSSRGVSGGLETVLYT